MTDESIEKLFNDALEKLGKSAPKGTKEIFEKLVNSTLEYRDKLVAKGEAPLTVAEVGEALNIFQNTLETKSFPKNIPVRIAPLIESWILSLMPKGKKQ